MLYEQLEKCLKFAKEVNLSDEQLKSLVYIFIGPNIVLNGSPAVTYPYKPYIGQGSGDIIITWDG